MSGSDPSEPALPTDHECLVVGAGPAGLTAALFLARYRRDTVVFHHASPRNLYAHGVHGFLGQHGIPPAELLQRGQDEVRQHGGVIVEACVTMAHQLDDGRFELRAFTPSGAELTRRGERVLLATGLKDLTPDCPGFLEFYGTSVFHCPDCDGYEVTGRTVAVLCRDHSIVGFAKGLLTWTDRLVALTDGAVVEPETREALDAMGIPIRERRVARLEGDEDRRQLERVLFEGDEPLECDALFFQFGTVPASDLHHQLGCKLEGSSGLVWANAAQETSVSGVYAAGDITPQSQLAIVAAAEGAMAAISIHRSLVREEQPSRHL
jgi:thioredoxin reductase